MAVSLSVVLVTLAQSAATLGTEVSTVDEAPSWSDDVRPILSEHCFACHGPDPDARAAGFRLDTLAGMTAGEALDLSDPDESELLYRVMTDEAFDHMPPPGAGRPLNASEVDTLRRWIASGAEWESHWAYAPFAKDAGAKENGQETFDIDGRIAARLAERGLTMNEEAEPRALLRRLYFDVIGMPPTAEEIRDFAADPSEEAYAAHVDRLLASSQYGEHWARHWLDLARYADSHGYTIDGVRSIWPWRDWVIRAIVDDLPFDQFTIRQLAGDLLPGATRADHVATGFHRNTQINQEGGAKDEENRINAVIDRVGTTGAVWMGSSVACAQCHTHKFDPITHTEYFGLFAFFNSTEDGGVSAEPSMVVPVNLEEEEEAAAWEQELAAAEARYQRAWDVASSGWTTWQPQRATGSNGPELRPELSGAYRVIGQNPVYSTYVLEGPAPGLKQTQHLRIEVLADGGPGRGGNNFVLQGIRVATRPHGATAWESHGLAAARADFEQGASDEAATTYSAASVLREGGPGWAVRPQLGRPHVLELTFDQVVPLEGRELRIELVQEFGKNRTIGAFRMGLGMASSQDLLVTPEWVEAWQALKQVRSERPRLPRTLVMRERVVPRTTRRFERGSFLDQREEVAPGVPAALDHFSERGAPMTTRLDLARWLVHPDNALVHRVTVNRWWQQLFGIGIVPSENDFGLRGSRPTHPQLLEDLAQDYVAHGMSRRHTLRRILLSRAYRQSSATQADKEELDQDGAWLSRRIHRRLSGEVLRDSMLRATGLLSERVGGKPIQPLQPPGVFAFTQSAKTWNPSAKPDRFRRSIYTRIWRSSPFPFFSTFDAPSPGFTCTRRNESASPLQALALANDPLVIEIAQGMGDRLMADLPEADWSTRIQAAYGWTLGRAATPKEIALLEPHVLAVRSKRGDAAACTALARVLFNLYEFTHRP